MINKYKHIILDSSAFIALVKAEEGQEKVRQIIPISVMSTVNVAESSQYFIEKLDYQEKQVTEIIEELIPAIIEFNKKQAFVCADLISVTKPYGLSLGDRACLALSLTTGYPIYTADKIWEKLELPNIKIIQIR